MSKCLIAPSILSANFARLGEEVDNVLEAGADWVHFDVMDNHYVPNLTIGPLVCEALRKHGVTAPIDVHLMVKPVDRIIPDFAKAGASLISFHPEASEHVHRTIGLIRECGCQVGLVFNPATPLDYLEHTLDEIDLVLPWRAMQGGRADKAAHVVVAVRQACAGRRMKLIIESGELPTHTPACSQASVSMVSKPAPIRIICEVVKSSPRHSRPWCWRTLSDNFSSIRRLRAERVPGKRTRNE